MPLWSLCFAPMQRRCPVPLRVPWSSRTARARASAIRRGHGRKRARRTRVCSCATKRVPTFTRPKAWVSILPASLYRADMWQTHFTQTDRTSATVREYGLFSLWAFFSFSFIFFFFYRVSGSQTHDLNIWAFWRNAIVIRVKWFVSREIQNEKW